MCVLPMLKKLLPDNGLELKVKGGYHGSHPSLMIFPSMHVYSCRVEGCGQRGVVRCTSPVRW